MQRSDNDKPEQFDNLEELLESNILDEDEIVEVINIYIKKKFSRYKKLLNRWDKFGPKGVNENKIDEIRDGYKRFRHS